MSARRQPPISSLPSAPEQILNPRHKGAFAESNRTTLVTVSMCFRFDHRARSFQVSHGSQYALFRLVLPAQPVDATLSSALIRQRFRERTICLAELSQNLARAAFRLV
jgi:hypothetical protein